MVTKSFCATSDYKDVINSDGKFYVHVFPVNTEDGLTTYVEYVLDEEPDEKKIEELKAKALSDMRSVKLFMIRAYGKSGAVNTFKVNDSACWLDKASRVGLVNSLAIEESSGKAESTIYFNDIAYTGPITELQKMLKEIELYAIECYRVTKQHEAEINVLSDFDALDNYDFRAGYPDNLNFSI